MARPMRPRRQSQPYLAALSARFAYSGYFVDAAADTLSTTTSSWPLSQRPRCSGDRCPAARRSPRRSDHTSSAMLELCSIEADD